MYRRVNRALDNQHEVSPFLPLWIIEWKVETSRKTVLTRRKLEARELRKEVFLFHVPVGVPLTFLSRVFRVLRCPIPGEVIV